LVFSDPSGGEYILIRKWTGLSPGPFVCWGYRMVRSELAQQPEAAHIELKKLFIGLQKLFSTALRGDIMMKKLSIRRSDSG
jgi:hypothetical protein